jgi:hypothetical protein
MMFMPRRPGKGFGLQPAQQQSRAGAGNEESGHHAFFHIYPPFFCAPKVSGHKHYFSLCFRSFPA